MKKLFMFVLFILSISPLLAMVGTNVPIKADDVIIVPPVVDSDTLTQEQIDDLTNTSLLLEYLSQGGSIDYSNTSSGYTGEDLLDDFGDFVRDVLNGRDTVIPLLDFVNPFQSTITYHGLQPVRQAKNAVTNFLGLLPLVYGIQGGDDTPTPSPDVDYISYIDTINGDGFFFRNWNNGTPSQGQINSGYSYMQNYYPNYSYSWFLAVNNDTWGINYSNKVYCTDIKTVNIVSNNGQYSFSLPTSALPSFNAYYYSDGHGLYVGQLQQNFFDGQTNIISSSNTLINNTRVNNSNKSYTFTYTGTLEQCFQYISNNMRNVNIFVDDVLWSYVGGEQQNYSLDISTGTAVATNDYGYVHWVYDYEIYFDIEQIWEMLQTLVNRPTPQPITWNDFQSLIYDVDGNPAVGVKILQDEDNIDDYLVKHFGTLIPVFPVTVSLPVSAETVASLITIPVSVIPSDLLEVLETLFLGTLMVCLLQRLLE